jgi:hypothetical protein
MCWSSRGGSGATLGPDETVPGDASPSGRPGRRYQPPPGPPKAPMSLVEPSTSL